jgi:hypothetical protein
MCFRSNVFKTAETYSKLFEILKEMNCIPKKVVTDFEAAIIVALTNTFKEVRIFGCLFHLGQSVYRKIQKLGQICNYKKSYAFKKAVRMLLSLSFVPPKNIAFELENIVSFVKKSEIWTIFEAVFNYFKKTYISHSIFGIVNDENDFTRFCWSGYERILQRIPLTNNGVEAWNNCIKVRSCISHPNIRRFTNMLQKEEELTRIKLIKCKNGEVVSKHKMKNLAKEKRLCDAVDSYEIFENGKFLDAVCGMYIWKFEDD